MASKKVNSSASKKTRTNPKEKISATNKIISKRRTLRLLVVFVIPIILYLYFSRISIQNISGNIVTYGDIFFVTSTHEESMSPLCGCQSTNVRYSGITFNSNEFDLHNNRLSNITFTVPFPSHINASPAITFSANYYRIKYQITTIPDITKLIDHEYQEGIEIVKRCRFNNVPFISLLGVDMLKVQAIDSLATLSFIPPHLSESIIELERDVFEDRTGSIKLKNIAFEKDVQKSNPPIVDILSRKVACQFRANNTYIYSDSIISRTFSQLDSTAIEGNDEYIEDILVFETPFSLRIEAHNHDEKSVFSALVSDPLGKIETIRNSSNPSEVEVIVNEEDCGTSIAIPNEKLNIENFVIYSPPFKCFDCKKIETNIVIKNPYKDSMYEKLYSYFRLNEYLRVQMPIGTKFSGNFQEISLPETTQNNSAQNNYEEKESDAPQHSPEIAERFKDKLKILTPSIAKTSGTEIKQMDYRMPPYPKENGMRLFSDVKNLKVKSTAGTIKVGHKTIDINTPSILEIRDLKTIQFESPVIFNISENHERKVKFMGVGKIFIDGEQQGDSVFNKWHNIFLLISILAGLAEILSIILVLMERK